MNKILCILMTVLAMGAVIECNGGVEDDTNRHDICSVVNCVNEHHSRKRRANGRAVEILGGVERLVTGILKASLDGAAKVKAQRRRKTIIVGPGKHNKNRVTINSRRH